MQTGNRIGYHPETARDEIAAFPDRYAAAIKASEMVENQIKSPTAHPATADSERAAAAHQANRNRALADLHATP